MDATKLTAQEQEQEKAKFSFSGATLYGINAVIGSGIFLLPQKIYKGLGPASLAVMLGTALLVILLAVCLAETAGYFNKNGGAFQYSKAAFGNFVGFNVGFLGWVVTIIAWAAMAAAFARLFVITFKAFEPYELLLSVSLIILLSLMNISGLKTSKIFTLTATVAKLIPIVAFSLCAIFFIKSGIDKGNFTPFLQLDPKVDIMKAISSTAIYIFYGFIGFETMSIVAGEMRNPEKNVPRAILGSISIVSVLYMLIIAGTIAMLGSRILQTDASVQDAFVEMIGPAGAWIISIGALISITGLNIGESVMVPRYGAAIANEGLLPKKIAETNSKNAPIVAIIISGILAIVLLFSGKFEELAALSVVFRVPFGPVIPILAVLVSLVMIWGENPMNYVYGLIGVLVASAVYYIYIVLICKNKVLEQQGE